MAKEECLEMEGVVCEVKRNSFNVKLDNEHIVHCTLGGKLRKNYIRVVEGDAVTVEVSPYDLNKGRITYRHK